MKLRQLLLFGVAVAVVGCVPRQAPTPPPKQQPTQRPPRPVPPPPPPARDWRDIPLTPGQWFYREEAGASQALFGAANSEAQFIVRCDKGRQQVALWREGVGTAGSMVVRTTFTARNLPAATQREPLAYTIAALGPREPILDSIAFSRGRFTVEVPGLPTLIIPSWPEPARVIEDCRA